MGVGMKKSETIWNGPPLENKVEVSEHSDPDAQRTYLQLNPKV